MNAFIDTTEQDECREIFSTTKRYSYHHEQGWHASREYWLKRKREKDTVEVLRELVLQHFASFRAPFNSQKWLEQRLRDIDVSVRGLHGDNLREHLRRKRDQP